MSITNFDAQKNRPPFNSEKAIAALNSLQPKGRKRVPEEFSRVYEAVEDAIRRGISSPDILASLKSQGLLLSPVRFKKLRAYEAKHRGVDLGQVEMALSGTVSDDSSSESEAQNNAAAAVRAA